MVTMYRYCLSAAVCAETDIDNSNNALNALIPLIFDICIPAIKLGHDFVDILNMVFFPAS
jgi:hypothetical protein